MRGALLLFPPSRPMYAPRAVASCAAAATLRAWAHNARPVCSSIRRLCDPDGDRTDAALQVLDAVKQGLTYPGWEKDVRDVERFWARWGKVSHIQDVVAKMRRQQQQQPQSLLWWTRG